MKTKRRSSKKITTQDSESLVEVQFAYAAPQARKVCLAGDFNAWSFDGQPMRLENGAWQTSLRLAPGRYEYRLT